MSVMGGSVEALSTKTGDEPTEKTRRPSGAK